VHLVPPFAGFSDRGSVGKRPLRGDLGDALHVGRGKFGKERNVPKEQDALHQWERGDGLHRASFEGPFGGLANERVGVRSRRFHDHRTNGTVADRSGGHGANRP
jgi:hypothetical protein